MSNDLPCIYCLKGCATSIVRDLWGDDGKKIIFSSNRNNGGGHDTNVFIADWIE